MPDATGPAKRFPTSSEPGASLTFLFTDIEGSTERWEKYRDAMARALERHDALVRAAIEAHQGAVFKTVGDAFCAVFRAPRDALGAALAAQRAVQAEDWSVFGADFPALRIRIGIHAGTAQERGGDYFGPPVNRTARIEAAGHGGQILLSAIARRGVELDLPSGLRLRDLGEHRLKDLRLPERISQVVADDLPDVTRPLRTAGELGPRDRILIRDPDDPDPDAAAEAPMVVTRTSQETLAALAGVFRGDHRTLLLTPDQLREAARHRPADLTEYRLGRIAEWSQPRYRLDGRFVALTLLVDQGEEAASGRWAPRQERFADLGKLLAALAEPAVVVLGPPGSGKSTLLRHLELDAAIASLHGEDVHDRVTFFIQLNGYRPERPGATPPAPDDWLAARWAALYPDLPVLDLLLAEGRMILLLDAFNEMPAPSEQAFREQVGWWKDWLVRLARTRPGNRVVFSCRALDYSAPLSTPALRVPQVQIEPLSDTQVEAFLRAYSPVRGAEIWAAIAGTAQLEALRSPFFLTLLVDQVEATGDLAGNRAGLFTGFVRQALRREVERDNPLFALEALLASRDVRRIAQWQWKDAYELPERGALVPRLSALAYGMQAAEAGGGASQTRVDYDTALELVGHAEDEAIVKAGLAISVLDEDPAADEVLYRHQLVQEYFAARELAKAPNAELVRRPWRAAEICPSVREILETLPPAETLPPLPQTGWEETTLLAVAMAADAEGYLRAILETNLALAGRAAGLAELRGRLPEPLLDELRPALVGRSRDAEADLRDRIACALAVGEIGDPRFERRQGPHGAYLMPPLVEIPGGAYPIGEDEPIAWAIPGVSDPVVEIAHMPRHPAAIAAIRIGQFPVTNAEWRCFMDAGGYDDEQWWDTDDARAWRRGELANEGSKQNNRAWRQRFRANPELFEQMVDEGRFASDEVEGRWRRWLALDDADFELALGTRWQAERVTEPAFWRDERLNAASQPVVGVSWYEARAYLSWLGAQSGLEFRLPSEVEWEAAARGVGGRLYAYGDAFDAIKSNTLESRLRRPTPVGVWAEGDTPECVSDMAGNVGQWTSSAWGGDDDFVPAFKYPYDARDGREELRAGPDCARIVRGGAWSSHHKSARAACRSSAFPSFRFFAVGFRCCIGPSAEGG